MLGLALLLLFNLLGVIAQTCLHVPLPGNVIGLLLLLLCLNLKIVKLHWIDHTAMFMLRHMLLFFVPVILGVLLLGKLMKQDWLPITTIILISPLLTAFAAALTARLVQSRDPQEATDPPK